MIWGAVTLYAVLALFLAWRARRSNATGQDFWTAGRRLGPGSVGLSISAGFMSVSWSCVYATQLFYWYGLGAIWLITVPWLLALGGIFLLARRYRALPQFSQPEMIRRRFGKVPASIVALSLAAVFIVWGGAEVYVAAELLSPALGLSSFAVASGISLLVALYAGTGGFGAVVATDRLQFALVGLYVVAVAVLAWLGAGDAGGGRWPDAGTGGLRSALSWQDPWSPGLALIVLTLIAYVPGWLFETDLWLRVQAARDAEAARRGVSLAMLNALLFVGVLPMLIGILALRLYPPLEGVAPAMLGQDGDAIFAALVSDFAPTWLAALVALGLVAAAMSTIDTCCNVVALSVGYDLFAVHRGARPVMFSRIATLLAVLATWVFALNIDSLWHVFYLSGGILTCSVALPVAAVHMPRVSALAVTLSSLCGLTGTVGAYIADAGGYLSAWQPQWLTTSGLAFIVWGLLACIAGFAIGMLASPPPRPEPV